MKVVLAYSGGLDTSVIVKWIKDRFNAEVVTFAANVGQQEELDEKIIAYIHSLSKRELEDTLYDILYSGESWVFDKFVREHID